MYITVYFGEKPVFLCDNIDDHIQKYMHHPDAVFIDEVSHKAVNSLLHEIAKPEFHAGILYNSDLEELKKICFKHFKVIEAAGGLIVNERREVLLILRRGKWDLPKGKLNKGETIERCAIREVEEETGLSDLKLGNKLSITYHTYDDFGKHVLKASHWFKMTCSSKQKLTPQSEEQITEVKWVKKDDLQKYLSNTFSTIKEVLSYIF